MASSMLWRLFNAPSEALNLAQEAAVSRLALASRRAAGLDSKTAAGADVCAAYLVEVEATSVALRIQPAPRAYRAGFPINYRSLFPGENRSYRADILEASLEHYNVIWVNGEKFEFSAEATRRAEELQCAWIDLGSVLERWGRPNSRPRSGGSREPSPGPGRPTRAELTAALGAFDGAWASFEERYISELVQIEGKARGLIVRAIEHERRLRELEKQHGEHAWDLAEYREVQRLLVAAVAHLNSVANISRKGRDDLRAEVLVEARAVLRKRTTAGGSFSSAAEILSTDVVESFSAMRQYLCEVACCLARVDPHLGNNCGLVARLEDWEESWEVGAAYLQQEPMLQALCDAVAEMRQAQRFAPRLADMCEECDVELFMVLPRFVWLRFLAEPERHKPLMARLLPHRFVGAGSCRASFGPDLQLFFETYASLERALALAFDARAIKELLAKRVVRGAADGNDEDVPMLAGAPATRRREAKAHVEAFMHELEAWSIELQRHCPEDWNQYSAVLVHCLRNEADKERTGPFGV